MRVRGQTVTRRFVRAHTESAPFRGHAACSETGHPMSANLAAALDQGEEALAHDDLDRAEAAFRSVLALDPVHAVAKQALGEIRRLRTSSIVTIVEDAPPPIPTSCIVRLAVPLSRLLEDDVAAREAFVLSRLVSGPLAVADLLYLCDPPHDEVLDILANYLAMGFLSRV